MLLLAQPKGGPDFFFFFTFPISPTFDRPEFRRFCNACYALRGAKPSLTLNALRSALTVYGSDSPMTYQDLAAVLDQDYVSTAHQIAALADGRDGSEGLGLLERISGRHERARLVTCSSDGNVLLQRFIVAQGETPEKLFATTKTVDRTVAAINAALRRYPKMTVGTLCVFLYIATNQETFGYEGQPVKVIADALGISNLPKHLRALSQEKLEVPKLIGFHVNEYDQRIRLPCLTKAGLALQCDLVTALTDDSVVRPRLPRAEALDRLDSPDNVNELTDDDFDEIDWDT